MGGAVAAIIDVDGHAILPENLVNPEEWSVGADVVAFQDGRGFVIPASWTAPDRRPQTGRMSDRVLGIDREGNPLSYQVGNERMPGWFYGLTPCCGASFKGCDGYIGCRSCYADLDDICYYDVPRPQDCTPRSGWDRPADEVSGS